VTTTTYLTKSRFVLATECARKLTYAPDPRYPDAMEDDNFLKGLADGGHQVGALARLIYGGGTLITERDRKEQARRTAELLTRPDVTIYEGTVIHERLLVRCDILVKHGSALNLIEVKSKSSEPTTKFTKGNADAPEIAGDWEPYLYDLAYQAFVLQRAYPDLVVTPHLLLVDKTVPASVAGLNTIFTVATEGRNVAVTVAPEFDVTKLAPPVLREFDLSREIALLRRQPITATGIAQTFEDFVALLCSGLDNLDAADGPHALPRSVTPQCRDCSFYLDPAEQSENKRSGWHRCMAERYDKPVNIARGQTFFGLYKPGKGQIADFLLTQPLAIPDMPREAFTPGENASAVIDDAERQRLQWEEHHGETEPVILYGAFREDMAGWTWPLHFIDFETAAPALPYTQARRPYEPILFQFSHHMLHEDGRLEHRAQFLEATPGVASSLPTLRRLGAALGGDGGTVLHWWDHERTILNAVRRQILADGPDDAADLLAFLESLIGPAKSNGGKGKPRQPAPAAKTRLFDLGRLISRTAFYPGTGGSSSIKKVLPAALKASRALRERYSAPVYGTPEMPSRNFKDPAGFRWVVMDADRPRDPYTLLRPLVEEDGVNASEVEEHEGAGDFIANGGAAMMAYGKLQQPSLPDDERQRLTTQLLRYCELDTLAMVMVCQSVTEIGLKV
jgi:hypothetical protein